MHNPQGRKLDFFQSQNPETSVEALAKGWQKSITQFGLWFPFVLQLLIEDFKFIETRIPFLCFLLLGQPILIYLVFHFESIFPPSPVSFLFYK